MKDNELVANFIENFPQSANVQTCINDIISELGEVAKEVNIATVWGSESFQPREKELKAELGQLLFTVHQLIYYLGYDNPTQILQETIAEFERRYKINGHTGSSNYI